MKIVLDANVYISALLSDSGSPAKIMARWERGNFEVLITKEIMDEISRVLRYPRLMKRHKKDEAKINRYLYLLAKQATLVEPDETLTVVPDDETDNRYIECAYFGKADYVISGDNHLLRVGEYQGIFILPPATFMAMLDAGIE